MMSTEVPEEPLLSAPHYHWGSCMVCQVSGTESRPLKRCSRCNAIYYCSPEHQRKHWKRHKSLCGYLSAAAQEVGAECFFDLESDTIGEPSKWREFRVNAVRTFEIVQGRALEPWEKEMFLFPRVCRLCRKTNLKSGLDCGECMGVTYCSPEHRDQDRQAHQTTGMCKELRFCLAMDSYESKISVCLPSLPSELDGKYWGVSGEISSFLGHDGLEEMAPLDEMQHKFLCERLSAPLTLLHVLHDHSLSNGRHVKDQERLVVHVVGADVTEMLGIIKWEYVSHRLPQCRTLRFVFIGPGMDMEEDGPCRGIESCPGCFKKNKKVEYEISSKTYQDFVQSERYTIPDVVTVFNCGFGEHAESGGDPDLDTWKPALSQLVREADTPVIVTSYNLTEAEKDLKLISEANAGKLKVEVGAQENPFRGHRPFRDFEFCQNRDVFFHNQYYSVVKRLEKEEKEEAP